MRSATRIKRLARPIGMVRLRSIWLWRPSTMLSRIAIPDSVILPRGHFLRRIGRSSRFPRDTTAPVEPAREASMMIINQVQIRRAIVGVLGFAALAVGLGASGSGQQPKAPAGNEAPKGGPTKTYYGLDACYDCHSKSDPAQLKPPPVLCRCNEILIWEKGDKHRDA